MKKSVKKKIAGILLGMSLVLNSGAVYAQTSEADNITEEVTVSLNDEVLEEKGIFYQGKLYIPGEILAEKAGFSIEVDEESSMVNIYEMWYQYLSDWDYGYEEIDPVAFELSKEGAYSEFPEVPSFENTVPDAEFTGGVIYAIGDHVYRYTVENAEESYDTYLLALEEAGFQSRGYYSFYTSSIMLVKGNIELELAYETDESGHEIWVYIERMDLWETEAYPSKRFYEEWAEIPSFSYFMGIPANNESRFQTVDGKCFYVYEYGDFSYFDVVMYLSYIEELDFELQNTVDYTLTYVKGESTLRITVKETELSITGHDIGQDEILAL